MADTQRVALITGGSGGIGRAVARRLTGEGWRVALLSRRAGVLEEFCDELGNGALPCVADVTDSTQVQKAIDNVLTRWHRIDLVLVNAGLLEVDPIEGGDPDLWNRILDVNLRGAYETIRLTLPAVKRAAGRYVLVASVAGRKGLPNLSAYSASKAGLIALGDSLAAETEQDGVSVHTMALGPTSTPMLDRPGASPYQLDTEDVAEVVSWCAGLPKHVVIRELPLRAARRRREE